MKKVRVVRGFLGIKNRVVKFSSPPVPTNRRLSCYALLLGFGVCPSKPSVRVLTYRFLGVPSEYPGREPKKTTL